jgi:hypothetical protein
MRMRFRFPYRYALLLLAAVGVPEALLAGTPHMSLHGLAMVWGGSCDEGVAKILAGSRYFLTVTNSSDEPRQPRTPGWPEGYVLEAALDLPYGQPFVPVAGLVERLAPRPYLSSANLGPQYSLLTGDGDVNLLELNQKEFVLTIPSDLAGHTLTFRARYRRGAIDLQSKTSGPITVVPACDRSDTARIVATRIFEARQAEDHMRAMEIADSMLACNLSDVVGWKYAEISAVAAHQYDKALSYLERRFQDVGMVWVRTGSAYPTQLNRQAARDPEVLAKYQRARDDLLKAKAKYDQQRR